MDIVLVLNSDFTTHNVTSLRRGFVLVEKGRAEILQKGNDIITASGNFIRPIVILLLNYVRFRPGNLGVTRKRLLKRDGYECTYWGSKKNLTVDHIIPKSRGGPNSWSNLVTYCFRCNSIKDNKTPEEAGMKLRFKPYTPTLFSRVIDETVETAWETFKREVFR